MVCVACLPYPLIIVLRRGLTELGSVFSERANARRMARLALRISSLRMASRRHRRSSCASCCSYPWNCVLFLQICWELRFEFDGLTHARRLSHIYAFALNSKHHTLKNCHYDECNIVLGYLLPPFHYQCSNL